VHTLPASASNHLVRVLRFRKGSIITVFNGNGGEYNCTLLNENPKAADVIVNDYLDTNRESPMRITLIQGLSRSEHMDLTIQKATELGVTEILPVSCERSIGMKDDRALKKLERWKQIAISACEQSCRNRLPKMREISSLEDGLSRVQADIKIVLDPEASVGIRHIDQHAASVCILSGPEGGLSVTELDVAARAGYNRIRFGPRILRTETAAPALIAVLQTLWGDMG
jgi:16S rRNA (uracil1498-N3)-methyltransferase